MDSDNDLIPPDESGILGESGGEVKSNGVYHVEDVNGKLLEGINANQSTEIVSPSVTVVSLEGSESSSPGVDKRRGLKKWRRIPRELAKKSGSMLGGSGNGDFARSPVRQVMLDGYGNGNGNSPVTRADSDQGSRSSVAVSGLGMGNAVNLNGENSALSDDHQRNGRIGPGKKARGLKIEKEKLISSAEVMGSDSRSSNCAFMQGSNDVAGNGRPSGTFANHNEEVTDGKDLNEEGQIALVKSDAEVDKIGKHEGSTEPDPLAASVKGLHFAHEELEREVQKWRDIGKADSLILNDPMHEILELKDAKILELESALISGGIKTELEDLLMKSIQADVEYVVITSTSKSLAEGPLLDTKHYLHQKKASHDDALAIAKQDGKLEIKEDIKKLQNRVGRFTSCFMIQLILLIVALYLKFSPQNAVVVPT